MSRDPVTLDTPSVARAMASALSSSERVVTLLVDRHLRVHDANAAARKAFGPGVADPGAELARGLMATDLDRLRNAWDAPGEVPGVILLRPTPDRDDVAPGVLVSVLPLAHDSLTDTDEPGLRLLIGRSAEDESSREGRVLRAARWQIVGQLMSGVAHEINNRLSTVTTFSDLMLGDADPDSQEAEDLAEIKQAGLDTAALTRKLDLFAAGRVSQEEADLPDVVRGMEKLIRRFMGPEITLAIELAETCAPAAAPPVRIEEILMALVANARDAMPKGGTLTLRASPHEREHLSEVLLEVVDTGPRPPASSLALALEPFYSTRSTVNASGLGLPTVHEIVKGLGGDLEIRAGEHVGTRVLVYLPAASSAEQGPPADGGNAAAAAEHAGAGPGHPPHIGLVEPAAEARAAISRGLVASGLRVTAGASVAELQGAARFDAVVTDVPDHPEGGHRILAAIRAETGNVPVLLLRRRQHPSALRTPLPSVAELAKPTELGSIRDALGRLLETPRDQVAHRGPSA